MLKPNKAKGNKNNRDKYQQITPEEATLYNQIVDYFLTFPLEEGQKITSFAVNLSPQFPFDVLLELQELGLLKSNDGVHFALTVKGFKWWESEG